MILELVGGVVGIVGAAAVTFAIVSPAACVPPCPAQHPPPILSAAAPQYAMLAFLVILVAFGVASLALQWIGWSRLRDADRHRYGIGRTGLVLVIVGFVIALAASAVLYSALFPIAAGYASSGVPPIPPTGALGSALGPVAAAAGLLLLGAALALAGSIAVWVGLWRLDEDHGSGAVRAAIILEIVAVAVAALSFISYAAALVASALAFISYVLMILGLHGISVRAAPRGPGREPPAASGIYLRNSGNLLCG
jgi:MFS family permease